MLLGSTQVGDHTGRASRTVNSRIGARLTTGEARGVHFDSTTTAAPSGSPSWPRMMTRSPALSPRVTSSHRSGREADCHSDFVRLVVVANDHHEGLAALAHEGRDRDDERVWPLLANDLHLDHHARGERRRLREARAARCRCDVAGSTCGAFVSTFAASLSSWLFSGPGSLTSAGWPTTIRDKSDAGTAAITCSRDGSITFGHRVAGGGLDEIAGIVKALCHHAGKGRTDNGPA